MCVCDVCVGLMVRTKTRNKNAFERIWSIGIHYCVSRIKLRLFGLGQRTHALLLMWRVSVGQMEGLLPLAKRANVPKWVRTTEWDLVMQQFAALAWST